jgi:N-acetylglucosaminyldiphosphoundecaprenol N-acetyl-beta-D-mannosaminyltransferase
MQGRIRLFGIEIDAVRMDDAVDRLVQWIEHGGEGCRYVVTPNADHAVLLQEHAPLRLAYADAHLVLADGMPVVLASRLVGRPLPERVTGADLVPALFDAARGDRPLRVFLLGAGPGVAERAAQKIEARWPAVRVCGTYSPPMGFEHDAAENGAILARIAEASPNVLVVGLGAPKQEVWVHEHRHRIHARVALCVGATIDFMAGEKPRAPVWMRRCGLEWLHRLASDPGRLARRYARDAWVFPQLVWREWLRTAE